jgi:hypothetical protein
MRFGVLAFDFVFGKAVVFIAAEEFIPLWPLLIRYVPLPDEVQVECAGRRRLFLIPFPQI